MSLRQDARQADPVGYGEYKKQAAATVRKYGGEYIVRGGKTDTLKGDWSPKRIVMLEFESMQRAKEWLNCEEYREPRKMRHCPAETNQSRLRLPHTTVGQTATHR